jgi:Cap4 SAVED domain
LTAELTAPLPFNQSEPLPTPFLAIRVHDLNVSPSLTAVCAGYEDGQWRAAGLARHMLDWVPDFALRASERQGLNSGTAQEQIRRAIRTVFGNGSARQRGEPGEILLHIICRYLFKSGTVVNKVFFKTSGNDVVKGFDAVHIVQAPDGLELWLGEAKFYTDRDDAIRDAIASVRKHLTTDYLRGEFALVTDKIDDNWPHAAEVRSLIHENVPIQDVFRRVTVPVLLAYDSPAVQAHNEVCASFMSAFNAEMRDGWKKFASGCGAAVPIRVRLFLAPMGSKQALVAELDRRLPGWR